MPTFEKTTGGRVYLRPLERRFEIGDRVDVSGDQAEYLDTDRPDFERVESDNSDGGLEGEGEGDPETGEGSPIADGEGVCGVEMTSGSTCQRPAGECPYHGE